MRQIGFSGAGFQYDGAAGKRIDAVGERQCLFDQLLDQQHGSPARAQLAHHHEHAIDQDRREAGGRLVQHQQAWPLHQPLRDRQHLLLTAGERNGALVALGGDLGKIT